MKTRHKVNLSIWTVFVGRSLSVRIRGGLATGRASQVRILWLARSRQFGWKQESCRNLEESRYIQMDPVEIQEFLSRKTSCRKNPVKVAEKKEFLRPLQNHVPVNKFL
jgi:hypothetical protein